MAAQILAFPELCAARTKQRILAAAYRLYNDPSRVGIPEIAAAAGVSAADVESAFGDETGVRRAVLNELLAFALAGHWCFGHPER
jgi:AcrR family transcriptional regulator